MGRNDRRQEIPIIIAADAAQAEKIMNADPAVQSGVFTAELFPWMGVDWGNYG